MPAKKKSSSGNAKGSSKGPEKKPAATLPKASFTTDPLPKLAVSAKEFKPSAVRFVAFHCSI